MIGRRIDGFVHVAYEGFFIVADFHRASAEHVAGTYEDGITDFTGDVACAFGIRGDAVRRLMQFELFENRLKTFPVFGRVDHFRTGTDNVDAGGFQTTRQIERRLSAKLHDHAIGFHAVADIEDVFGGQWFEEQMIRSVIVSRNGFGIRVDHDAFDAQFLQREGSLTATVIEFNPLPDAVRSAAQNHDAAFVIWIARRFVFLFVGRIEVWCKGFEFGGTGIDLFERRLNAEPFAILADIHFGRVEPESQLFIGVAGLLGLFHGGVVHVFQAGS